MWKSLEPSEHVGYTTPLFASDCASPNTGYHQTKSINCNCYQWRQSVFKSGESLERPSTKISDFLFSQKISNDLFLVIYTKFAIYPSAFHKIIEKSNLFHLLWTTLRDFCHSMSLNSDRPDKQREYKQSMNILDIETFSTPFLMVLFELNMVEYHRIYIGIISQSTTYKWQV